MKTGRSAQFVHVNQFAFWVRPIGLNSLFLLFLQTFPIDISVQISFEGYNNIRFYGIRWQIIPDMDVRSLLNPSPLILMLMLHSEDRERQLGIQDLFVIKQ